MKKTMLILAGVVSAAAIAYAASSERVPLAIAADHLDSPSAAASGTGDITDLYAWMWDDAGTPALALVVAANPIAVASTTFPQDVHYVVNVDRGGTATKVICQFESDDNSAIRCWVGDETTNTILSGDATSASAPLETDGIKVFAGRRKDPFTFNFEGFQKTQAAVAGSDLGPLADPDNPGCFDLSVDNVGDEIGTNSLGEALVRCISTKCTAPVGDTQSDGAEDFFAALDVLALTVSIPLDKIAGDVRDVTVYASTHSR